MIVVAMNKTITLLLIGVIFLALLLMMFNSFRKEAQYGDLVSATEKARSKENAPLARVAEERFVAAPALAPSATATQSSAVLPLPVPEVQSSAALTPPATEAQSNAAFPRPVSEVQSSAALPPDPEAAPHEGVTVNTVPAQIDAGRTPAASPPLQTAMPSRSDPPKLPAMPEPGAKQTRGGANTITSIVVYATQEGATLRLGGDRPFVCKDMLLRDPDRLVLDFEGHWNVTIPGIPQNRLIKAIRVGRQADFTRMVVDLHRAPASYRLITTSPQGLDVRLR